LPSILAKETYSRQGKKVGTNGQEWQEWQECGEEGELPQDAQRERLQGDGIVEAEI
jgi:hypothetical protein